MSNKNNTLPIGKLLQSADLISSKQLEMALEIQSQYTKMRLGEILALQEAVEVQTVDFFVNRWQKIKQEGQQFPLGYYLKQANLLDDTQIQVILAEQKITQLKFGSLAVKKGWLKQGTIDFFLNSLALKRPKSMSLITLEEYNQESLHLERKYANPPLILSRILAWTGGNPNLTKAVSNVFADSDWNITAGGEVNAVDQLIESSIIRNWQKSQLGTYIRSVKDNLVNNNRCEPILLLSEYQDILLSDKKKYQKTKEQNELLNLGLIVENENHLKITNLIFQQVFNQNWLAKTKRALESQAQQDDFTIIDPEAVSLIDTISQSNQIAQENFSPKIIKQQDAEEPNTKNTEPITKIGSLLTLVGVVLFIPLILAINNYYSSKQSGQLNLNLDSSSPASKLKQFCSEINLVDPPSSISLISQIEKNKQIILGSFPSTLEGFPDNCETAINKLRVSAAPQLGKEGRVIEAIKNICKIPADADNINEAKIWIEHWYTSASWGQQTKSYLSLIDNDCPASK